MLLIIPVMLLAMWAGEGLARLLIIINARKRLTKWIPGVANVTSVEVRPVSHNKIYVVRYYLETGNGEKYERSTYFQGTPSYDEDGTALLYDPDKPSLSRLEKELRDCGLLERDAFKLKSGRRLSAELMIRAAELIATVPACALLVFNTTYDATVQSAIRLGLFFALLFGALGFFIGLYNARKFFPGKLD